MKKRILIIEDDSVQRELFTTHLENAGYDVFQASNGEHGLRIAREHPCDLVITDIFMPGKTGFETIFDLKTEFPHLKIIAISGGAVSTQGGDMWARYYGTLDAGKSLDTARQFGANSILHKPIKLRLLVETVDELLQTRDLRSYLNQVERSSYKPLSLTDDAKKRILVIDDDASQRQLFKTALEQAGYAVLEAADGATGVSLYSQHPCALVIMDIFMPEQDGIETIFDFKTQYPDAKIIAISGGGSWTQHGRNFEADDSLEMARRFGAIRTLKKPIKLQHLLNILADLLHEKDQQEPQGIPGVSGV